MEDRLYTLKDEEKHVFQYYSFTYLYFTLHIYKVYWCVFLLYKVSLVHWSDVWSYWYLFFFFYLFFICKLQYIANILGWAKIKKQIITRIPYPILYHIMSLECGMFSYNTVHRSTIHFHWTCNSYSINILNTRTIIISCLKC